MQISHRNILSSIGAVAIIALIGVDGLGTCCLRIDSKEVLAMAVSTTPGPTNSNDETVPEVEIGGQQVVKLRREPSADSKTPEFLSATILPGRGMNLFQITAMIPGRGLVDVFASPSLDQAAKELNGGPDDQHGVRSFAFGGAFLAPYPNRIRGKLTADGKSIVTSWHGREVELPAVWKGKANANAEPHAIHGLILDRKADDLHVTAITGGSSVTGVIHAGDFDGHWFSKSDLAITVSLTGPQVEATIKATNVGEKPQPIGVGWHPYFAIPSGDRAQARLHIPASQLALVNNYDDVFPTGELKDVHGSKYDFTAAAGQQLGDAFLDDNFSHLSRKNGAVVVKLVDPAAKYGISIEGLSPQIKTVQVYAPPDKPFAAIEEQFNFADPFSPVWKKMDTGMVILEPRHSVTWKVRLRLFTPSN